MYRLFLAIALVIALPQSARAWTFQADFEAGSEGARAIGPSGFHEAGSKTTFSAEKAHQGTQSARMVWDRGNVGFDTCMGYTRFPEELPVGQEIWGRAYYYFQSPWQWDCHDQSKGCPAIKVFRFRREDAAGNNRGYVSIYGNRGKPPYAQGRMRIDNEMGRPEPENWNIWQNVNPPETMVQPDRWYSLEFYVYYHPTDGIIRMWIDGELKVEKKGVNTALSASDRMKFAYLMSYWNGGAARDQVQYVDDVIITTDRPANRDVAGNPMIGPCATAAGTEERPPEQPPPSRGLPPALRDLLTARKPR